MLPMWGVKNQNGLKMKFFMFFKRFYHINTLEIKWSEGFNCKVISYTSHTFIKFLFLRYYPVCYQPIKFRILWTAISSLISSVFIMDGSLCVFWVDQDIQGRNTSRILFLILQQWHLFWGVEILAKYRNTFDVPERHTDKSYA